ncbi:MAG: ABC-F family ATP-binding cassette domain-containing protein [Pseudomonadota bacterium]
MLTIEGLSFNYSDRVLFEKADAQISAGWKVGLVGRNGSGKSTLLRLIVEAFQDPTEWPAIRFAAQTRLGWVAQEVSPTDTPLLETVLAADEERHALLQQVEDESDPNALADAHARLVDIEAWSGEARAARILAGLGFKQSDMQRPMHEFSGGWRMRAALAGVLFSRPDLLLLDEPTNYLDLEGAAWLESYLKTYPGTVITVSHDRDLLNRSVSHILALEHGKLHLSPGGYDAWLRLRAAHLQRLEAERTKQENERAHLQSYIDRFRYKESKARQAQSKIKRLEKMKEIDIPLAERTVPFVFSSGSETLAPPMLILDEACLGYGEDAVILDAVSLRIDPEDRVAIVGSNGEGKTTLVKSIASRLQLMSGKRTIPSDIRIAYFSQDQMESLRPEETVLDHVRRALPTVDGQAKLRARAAQLGFSHQKIDTKTVDLSGGERVRLLLGLVTLNEPHLLILDEPTSHLDLDSREALIHAINDFEGAVLLITHDTFLAEATAEQLWLVKDGDVRPYDGSLDDYRSLVLSADRPDDSVGSNVRKPDGMPRADKTERRKRASQRRQAAAPIKRRAEQAERALDKAGKEIAAIDIRLAQPNLSSEKRQKLMLDRAAWKSKSEEAEMAWLEATEAYETALAEAD